MVSGQNICGVHVGWVGRITLGVNCWRKNEGHEQDSASRKKGGMTDGYPSRWHGGFYTTEIREVLSTTAMIVAI
jgi:hypothetical protein